MASPPRLKELWEETEDGEDSETGGDKVLVPVTLPKERKETVRRSYVRVPATSFHPGQPKQTTGKPMGGK